MKAAAYSIKEFEKPLLEKANQEGHDISYLSLPLNPDTVSYAKGCKAVIVFVNDDLSASTIRNLAQLGVKYIITRSAGTDHIDFNAVQKYGIQAVNIPSYSPEAVAEHAVAMAMTLARKLIISCINSRSFNFKIDDYIGFNFYGKTVGLIGFGRIGKAAARIFSGLGCNVWVYDLEPVDEPSVRQVNLKILLQSADIISLHVPLTPETSYLINRDTIAKMKKGVMLINTSRGKVLHTEAVLEALKTGQIGYLGLDVYEYEKGLFFEDHQQDVNKDALLTQLLNFSNVLITPHQAFLTKEAVEEIAAQTIMKLNDFATS